jgi:ribonuclease D
VEVAAQRGVDADVVLNNETLMAIARARPTTLEGLAQLGLLGSWKLKEYGAALLRALGGQQ